MALHDRPVRLTYADYLLFPEDGQRHEIIDGEHYVSAAPFIRHQVLSRRLNRAVGDFVEDRGLGQMLYAPVDVVLSPYDIVQPDLVFVSKERAGILTEKNIQGAPDLLIEILSERTRRVDEEVKLHLYERFGVREYWLVDPRRESVRVYRLQEDSFHPLGDLAAGDVLSTPLLPGLTLPVAEIFRAS
jgi:Uma2 family endonuclease